MNAAGSMESRFSESLWQIFMMLYFGEGNLAIFKFIGLLKY